MRLKRAAAAGFTLVELMITLSLLGVVAGSVFMVLDSTNRAVRTGVTNSQLEALGRRTLERVAGLLTQTRRDAVWPPAPAAGAPASTARVDFSRVIGFDGIGPIWDDAERIEFRYQPGELDDGVDNNANGLVDEGQVVWITDLGLPDERAVVLCGFVAEVLDGEVLDGLVDENGNGLIDERGLAFDFDGERVTIRLTLQRMDGSGAVVARTFERTIAFRQG